MSFYYIFFIIIAYNLFKMFNFVLSYTACYTVTDFPPSVGMSISVQIDTRSNLNLSFIDTR